MADTPKLNIYCAEYWHLYDIWTDIIESIERGISIDPAALVRAEEACNRHKRECQECKRKESDDGR
jgi:hypothetical protein